LHVSGSNLTPWIFGVVAVLVTIVAWAGLARSSTSPDRNYAAALPDPATVNAVAYAQPVGDSDVIYTQPIAGGEPRYVAAFPYTFSLHARGSASPDAKTLAVLHVGDAPGALAVLSLVAADTGATRTVETQLDYLSPLAWSFDGTHLAAVRGIDGSDRGASVFEIDATTATAREVARFATALEVVPVGYSVDGDRLFIVVIDQSGSNLWVEKGSKVSRVASLSSGLTRDWSLSPDGARLAYIERLGAGGERSYAGRVLTIATGAIAATVLPGDQLGTAWRPGAAMPDFGGPSGSLRLTEGADGSYVVPMRWAPDGVHLAAAVFTADSTAPAQTRQSVEIVSADRRIQLAEGANVQFFGWVTP
jgi:hypothetical protein